MKKRNLEAEKQREAAVLLKTHRKKIDALDARILALLGARFDVIRAVAKIKEKHDIPAILHDRVVEVRENAVRNGRKYGIDAETIRAVYTLLIYRSCELEEELKTAARKKAQGKRVSRK